MIHRRLFDESFNEGVNVFALDYYRPSSQGEDDFSREQTWFYLNGDEELQKKFKTEMSELVEKVFVETEIEWDMIAPVPAQKKDRINPNMEKLVKGISKETGITYSEPMNRKNSIAESHELENKERRKINIQDSTEISSTVEDKNIIIVDNVSRSGITLLHTANRLIEEGANRVECVTIGLSDEKTKRDMKIEKEIPIKTSSTKRRQD